MSTEERVIAAQRGDHEAFCQLVSADKMKLYSIAFAYLKDETDALEAIQEATCRAYTKLSKLREPRYFQTWLICILIHVCIDEQKRKRTMLPLFELPEPLAADLALDDKIRLKMAVDLLPPKFRHIIILKYYQDMTLSEIADDSRMVMFYEIRMPGKGEPVQLERPALVDASGKALPASVRFNSQEEEPAFIRGTGIQRGTADFQLAQGASLPKEVIFNVRLTGASLPGSQGDSKPALAGAEDTPPMGTAIAGGAEFKLTIPIDRTRFAGLRHEYSIGQSILVEGQRITFSKAVITPLRIALYLGYPRDNTKRIFGPGDIRLVDDEGTVWRNTAGSLAEDQQVYYFESPYFKQPKSLPIEGSWFRALDRSKLSVTVDTGTGWVLEAPDGKVGVHAVTKGGEYTKLDFILRGVDPEDHMLYTLFEGEFTDAAGTRYKTADLREHFSGSRPGEQHALLYIGNQAYQQPLTFAIFDYPAYIRQPYQIRIK